MIDEQMDEKSIDEIKKSITEEEWYRVLPLEDAVKKHLLFNHDKFLKTVAKCLSEKDKVLFDAFYTVCNLESPLN